MIYQAYNKRIKAWVKLRITKKGSEILYVKKREKSIPFKNIKIK
jgi:hypothetical protein